MKNLTRIALVAVAALALSLSADAAPKKKAKKAAKPAAQTQTTTSTGSAVPAEATQAPVATEAATTASDQVATTQAAPQTTETTLAAPGPVSAIYYSYLNSNTFKGENRTYGINWNHTIGPKFTISEDFAISVRPQFSTKFGTELGSRFEWLDHQVNLHGPKGEVGNGFNAQAYLRYLTPTGVTSQTNHLAGTLQPRAYISDGKFGRFEFSGILYGNIPLQTARTPDGAGAPSVGLFWQTDYRLSSSFLLSAAITPAATFAAKNVSGAATFDMTTDLGFTIEAGNVKINPYVEFDAANPRLEATNFQTYIEWAIF